MTLSNGNCPRNCPFVRGIHRSPANSPQKGQWRGALMFSLICAWINGWVNNGKAGILRRHRAHYDVIVITLSHFSKVASQTWFLRKMSPYQYKHSKYEDDTVPWMNHFLTRHAVNNGGREIDIHGCYSLVKIYFAPICAWKNIRWLFTSLFNNTQIACLWVSQGCL